MQGILKKMNSPANFQAPA